MSFLSTVFITTTQKISSITCNKINLKIAALVLLTWSFFVVLIFLKNAHTNYPELPRSLDQHIHEELRDFIYSMNTKQIVYNHQAKRSIDLVIVIQMHDRVSHVLQLIESFSQAQNINNTLLIFSHSIYMLETFHAIQRITFAQTMQIFYPFSSQMYRNEFPGPSMKDFSGSIWRNATLVQEKHHWWWTANFVFNKVRLLDDYTGLVLFIEDSNYLSPDFIHCIYMMNDYKMTCPDCWFFSLGLEKSDDLGPFESTTVVIRNTLETLGLSFSKTVWNELSKNAEHFCKYDDYNWNWSLRYVTKVVIEAKILTMTMALSRIKHLDSCSLNCSDSFSFHQFPEFLDTKDVNINDVYKKHGGWGDDRDQALCLGM